MSSLRCCQRWPRLQAKDISVGHAHHAAQANPLVPGVLRAHTDTRCDCVRLVSSSLP